MVTSKNERKWLGALYALIVIHLLWWLASLALNKAVLPSPWAVYQHFPVLLNEKIGWHIYFSLYRLFWSILIATIIGVAVGLVMATSPRWRKLLDPLVYFTYPIPKIALLPVVMLLFGLGETSKITMLVLIIVFQIMISVRDSILEIPAGMYQSLQVLGASKWQLFRHITFPASFAALLSTLRVALGTAIAILFFTEVYGTEFGLGYFIMDAWYRLDYLDMYAGIVVLSLVAFILFYLLNWLEKRFVKK